MYDRQCLCVFAVMLNPVHVNASSVNASHAVVSWTFDSITSDHPDTFQAFNVSVVSPWQSVSHCMASFIVIVIGELDNAPYIAYVSYS